MSDTATCTGGKVAIAGGGTITSTQAGRVAALNSIATSATTWQCTGIVTQSMTGGNTFTVTAQAVCVNP